MLNIQSILDNRWLQKTILPIAIVNTIQSYSLTRKEFSIIQETINENNDFFKSIATLGFAPKTMFSMSSILPYDNELTIEDIQTIAQKTIIGVILQYVKDENLLGIVNVDCKIDKKFIVTTIQPVTLKVLLLDIHDFAISLLLTAVTASICYAIFQ